MSQTMPAGATALLAGTAVALLCVSTTTHVSPVASALGGADLSALSGPAVAALCYIAMARRQVPARAGKGARS